jgi:hypothetical protein
VDVPASQGLLGRIQRANEDASRRFGPNTAEVEAFINTAAQLTPWQWRQVLAVRRLVVSISKEGTGQPADSARSIQAAIRTSDTRISEPMARAGEVLFDTLAKKSEEKQVAAWQAMSALVMRSQLPALKFAAHYAPFASFIPVSGADVLDARSRRFVTAIEALTKEQCELLSHRWRINPAASHALLQAVAKNRHVKSEEVAAMSALSVIPTHLPGDPGWSAVRTVVHGGRVLGSLGELSQAEITELWVPLEAAIPFDSLDAADEAPAPERVRAAVSGAIKSIKATGGPARVPATPAAKAPAPYGPNSSEVSAFIKGVSEMTPIQWLRVLDRRKLVASITREGSAEPAGVVRSILAAIEGTRELAIFTRCRVFAAVERAGYAAEAQGHMTREQVDQMYKPFAASITLEHLNGGGFAHKVASLSKSDWEKVAAEAPEANEEAVAPLVNAGTALIDFFGGRSDDEAVATWHAVSAVVRRNQLTAIKFAASYAPFSSAIAVTSPRSLGAMVSRYVTAIGRLGATQCAVLAQPWQISDDLSNVLSKALADGSARPAEEAAALAAVVTVPMRLSGSNGWAAVKTAAFGGRVIACRSKLTPEQLESLWKPIHQAIPLASLGAPARPRR